MQYALHDDEQLFFLHIPKTAGTTFRLILENQFKPTEICKAYYEVDLPQDPGDPKRFRFFRGHIAYVNLRRWMGYEIPTICMIREPTDRYLSHFAYLKTQSPGHKFYDLAKDMTIEDYAFTEEPELVKFMVNVHTSLLKGKLENLEAVFQRLENFVFLGLQERFDDSVTLLNYTMGWRPLKRVKTHNVTPKSKKLAPNAIPAHVVERIHQLNDTDVQIYKHSKGIFEKRYNAMLAHLVDQFGDKNMTDPTQLDHDQVFTLLQRHHKSINAMKKRHWPGVSLDLTQDQPAIETGWHRVHVSGQYRWTGPETTAVLSVNVKPYTQYHLRLQVARGITTEVLDSLYLKANGQKLDHQQFTQADKTRLITATIPAHWITQKRLTLELVVEQTVIPYEMDPERPDKRQLGVAISWVKLSPLFKMKDAEAKEAS